MRNTVVIVLGNRRALVAYAAKGPLPVVFEIPTKPIDYLKEVKPLLAKRCAVCHSCYNSPCQLKLDSFEGVDRGARKIHSTIVHKRIGSGMRMTGFNRDFMRINLYWGDSSI